ncbi:MAG TPA: hypothetical protein VKS60_12440 [Stellaceae bacterium]|nr:hypothetical protein [Stellaceae bacterium]
MRALIAAIALAATMPGAVAARAQDAPQVVATYHNAPDRNGLYTVPGLTGAVAATVHPDTAFSGTVKGNIYAQPLYWRGTEAAHGLVIVATESNNVYALDATTGAVIWHVSLGPSVANSELPCGNIDPVGVTGTPAIDRTTGALYVAAMVDRPAGPQHMVYALSVHTGATLPGWPVNVHAAAAARGIAFSPSVQEQRSALSLVEGKLYVGYGGHYGDCNPYHGWVVGFDPAGPSLFGAWGTRASKGGIWAPGGLAAKAGRLFAATGNTAGATSWGDGEAIIHVPLTLTHPTGPAHYFTPSNWQALDNADLDLGGTGPLPVEVPTGGTPAEFVLALGKDGSAYLLDQANLGGVGGALASATVSSNPIRTSPAAYETGNGTLVAVTAQGSNCGSSGTGLTVLKITAVPAPAIATAWCAGLSGQGAPIITTSDGTQNPIVWATGAEGDNQLHGFNATTGAVVFAGSGTQMSGLRHFGTIMAAEGRLYIAADNRIYAFAFNGL